VIGVLAEVIRQRGAPGHVRSDNGPEFIAQAIRAWLQGAGVGTLYIEPGAPWENGYAESFNSKLRDELLEREEFGSVLEARVLGQDWKGQYNTARPHSALGYRTPVEFAASCPRADCAKPPPARKHDGDG
jgi:putative transposase